MTTYIRTILASIADWLKSMLRRIRTKAGGGQGEE